MKIGIIGAGLVGSLLAIYLKKRGYAVSVYERRPDMRRKGYEGGRSINLALSNRGIRALHEVGMEDDLRKNAIPMHGRMMHSVEGELTYQAYGKEGQYINSISRSGLNRVLVTEAERLGVSFFFDHRVERVDLEATTVTFAHPSANKSESFDYLIGADGAFSAVRGAMQLTDRFDFSQDYIEHGYKELTIPAGAAGRFPLEKNALHIWPRESYMLIALPNPDGSFTCTLFFPFEGNPSFESLQTEAEVDRFFKSVFPDAAALIPDLIDDYRSNPTSSLVTMKCYPWVRHHTLLIGDAAHAIVPFYGQGMNAGFEDCRVLNDLLDHHQDDWDRVLPAFQQLRKPDADAIAQLALDNFVEMRDLVGDADFLLRKKIEAKLHALYPDKWIPLYSMVTFHDTIRYSEALRIGRQQKKIMDEVMKMPPETLSSLSLDFEKIMQQLG
ncbi:MAG: FAD-dependent monooxygenase [Cyclobacteriaceae bacterium]|jgi:kynurenine 3-monooxygenase|nr:FAD-dependent monooxygenase [Cyclobacteriaceae bacterium]